MKYNIGDKVFNTANIEFFDNIYHYENKMNSSVLTVKQANKKYFSIYDDFKLEDDFCGMNSFQRYNQANGKQHSSHPDFLLHCEKDKNEIIRHIREYFKSKYELIENEITKEVEKTKNKIADLESKLVDLGRGIISITCKTNDANKWTMERENEGINLISGETKD